MNAALLLLGYGCGLAWLGPRLLRRVTGIGAHPRLALASWLTAVVAALGAWFGALAVLGVAAAQSMWRHGELTLCLKVLGVSGALGLPRAAASALAVCLWVAGVVVTAVAGWRIGRQMRRQRARSRLHASTARVVGVPGDRPGVVVVAAPQAAAYCVTDRPHSVVVVTTAALGRLDEVQLAAVLAHENAHLAGRHHDVLMVLRAIAASLPRWALFPAAAEAAAGLLEMCADDSAVRLHGKMPVLRGLLALSGDSPALASAALGASGTATLARVARLAIPVSRRTRWRERVTLCAAICLASITPAVVALACQL
ncbi:M48 family metalloprotease [Mycobacterium sp. HUMS_1102779]|uniref:M48 family metalloprotease n=1 Tax=Mycobacterium sp. HUMS_1102779 TaxID=3383487 RepID=UPI003899921F